MSVSKSCLVLAMLVACPCALHAQVHSKTLDATLRQLEKEITAVRGLAFKKPVVAKVIARPAGDTKGVQGFYNIKEKALYLYDDIKGAYARGVLIHEMVHALQDQHFGLANLHQTDFGSDAELARAAFIEGDATLTMIEVLKKDQPKAAAMLTTSLENAKNLRKTFLYGIGAQYVKRLKDKGGWASVNARYRFPPSATSAILSSEGANTINLGPGRHLGALRIIEHFADNPRAKPLAIKAVNGLLADRLVEDGAVKSWQLAFHRAEQAMRFQDAYAATQAGTPLPAGGALLWRGGNGRIAGIAIHGTRVAIVEAPNLAAFRGATERLDGPPSLVIWSSKERHTLTFGELVDRLLDADLICVGKVMTASYAIARNCKSSRPSTRDARLGVGMEMFQRPFQAALDKFSRGECGEDDMLKATEYRQRWGYHWSLYQPIVDFCKKNGIPLAALNAPKELTAKISKNGFKNLAEADKKALGPVDFHVKAHRDHWYEALARMHGNGKVSADQKERSYQVMTAWDEYMGASAAEFQMSRRVRRMIVLAGSGHIDLGFGIPQRAIQRTGGKAVTVHLAPAGDAAKLFASPPADYVAILR